MKKDLKDKKVLVTGGLGFVGSNLVDRLVERGAVVVVVDNLSSESASKDYVNPEAKYWFISVEDFVRHNNIEELKPLEKMKYDAVFHLAANARIQPSFSDPMGYFKANAEGTALIAEFVRNTESGTLVYATTSSKAHGRWISPYTTYKVVGEDIIKMYAACFGINAASATFYNVFGPREPREGEWATVVAKFLRQWEAGEPMTVVGTGEQSREFTHVYDIVDGLIKIWTSGLPLRGDNFDLGSGVSHSVLGIAKMIADEDQSKWTHVPLRKNEGLHTVSDCQSTEEKIGWKAEYTLVDYLNNIIKQKEK